MSLASHKYNIKGFTKSNNDSYYMVANKLFYHYYSRYGFCTACGILRCSPAWCICGHRLATISNSMSLSRNLNYKQTQQIMPIWNGFHTIVFIIGNMKLDTWMAYLLMNMLN